MEVDRKAVPAVAVLLWISFADADSARDRQAWTEARVNYLKVKNWDSFQHYKDRNPPWIKLHRALLDDYEFASLEDAVKGQLMLMWLFASQNEGKIPHDAKFLERKLGLTEKCRLDELIRNGFLIPEQPDSADASNAIAGSKQVADEALALARSREESQRRKATETEMRANAFESFWQAFPRKVAKPDAEKAWKKVSPEELPALMAGLSRAVASDQWRSDGGKYIPYPATWLNKRRWEDVQAATVNGHDHGLEVEPDLMDLLQREARKHMGAVQ